MRRKAISEIERDPYAWLDEKPKSYRTYDSSLNKPGRICGICRTFVPGGEAECKVCWTIE